MASLTANDESFCAWPHFAYRSQTDWAGRHWLAILFAIAAAALAGCGRTDSTATKPIPKEVIVEGEIFAADYQPWPKMVRSQGSLVAADITTVASKVPGRVAQVTVDLGDEVAADQPLVMIEQQDFLVLVEQAEAQLRQARSAVGLKPGDPLDNLVPANSPPAREAAAVLEDARNQFERVKQLRQNSIVSVSEFEQAESTMKVADARYSSVMNGIQEKIALVHVQQAALDSAKQRLADSTVLAPFDGKIQSRAVSLGSYVQAGQPLMSIVSSSRLRFRGSVPERFAYELAVGQDVVLQIQSIPMPIRVSVTRISPTLDEMSRSLLFEAAVELTELETAATEAAKLLGDRPASSATIETARLRLLLRPGLFAEADVVLDPDFPIITVPRSALVRFAGTQKVWKVVDGKVIETAVAVGRETPEKVQIINGLSAGDFVLLDGKKGRPGTWKGVLPSKPNASGDLNASPNSLLDESQPQTIAPPPALAVETPPPSDASNAIEKQSPLALPMASASVALNTGSTAPDSPIPDSPTPNSTETKSNAEPESVETPVEIAASLEEVVKQPSTATPPISGGGAR